MAFTSIVQVIKLNEPRKGKTANGREWEMQDAECILLNADGTPEQVGVLVIPKALMGTVQPGTYSGSFAMRADTSKEGGRRLKAELIGLTPIKRSGTGFVPAEAPKAS